MIELALGKKRILIEPGEDSGTWDIFPDAKFLTSPDGPIVFVVHGYNNDQIEAEASYSLLRENLREILGEYRHRLNHIWELYWPGYLPKGTLLVWRKGPANLASALSYSLQEQKTASLGKSIAEYIRKIPGPYPDSHVEVIFIAHSLGCRVVMEALHHLDASPVHVPGICLMAAAVPVSKVEPSGELRGGAEKPDKVYILHSTNDGVLHWTFRPGQFVSNPLTFPEAVGRFGNPFRGWLTEENVLDTGLGHGEYYAGRPEKSSEPSRTRPTIARLFGRPAPNQLVDRNVVEWPALLRSPEPVENRLLEYEVVAN